MNVHNINTIARYEVKLLRRSWLFRTFAILALFIISIAALSNLSFVFWRFSETWDMTGVSSLPAFFSIYLYSIAQSVIVIFLAGSFLKRDKKLDTAEVIYVRPMSNADYIVGKVWGILRVFVSLNLIVMGITAFICLAINSSPFSLFPYVFYIVTISIPALLFVLGLAFTMMCFIKNQAVTFIVMLGIVGVSFFYLAEPIYGIFDFSGVNIPAIFSDAVGHADIRLFLLQRATYLVLGIGFICLTITLVNRLPHRPWKTPIIRAISVVVILMGCGLGMLYVLHYRHVMEVRNGYISTYNQYVAQPKANVLKNDIAVRLTGRSMEAESRITVMNSHAEPLKEVVLYLNPGFVVTSVESEGKDIKFARDRQVLRVEQSIAPQDTVTFMVKYGGVPDENIGYTDINEKDFIEHPKASAFFFRYGKRYLYLDERFVLLTPEVLWYPTAIPSVNPQSPYAIKKQFSDYKLTVEGGGDRTVLSQGDMTQKEGQTLFANRTPLTGISLTLADYEKKSVNVDSVDYELYYFKGHDFFSKHFAEVGDTLPVLIREARNDMEIAKGRNYPYRKFVLAEVPLHFTTYIRNWKGYTEAVMPQIVFLPERGIGVGSDFRATKQRVLRWTDNENMLDIDAEVEMFKRFVNNTFVAETEANPMRWETSPKVNKYNQGAQFLNHTGFIYSLEYPIIDIAVNTMLNAGQETSARGWGGQMVMNDVQRANLYLQSNSFQEALQDDSIKPQVFYELLKLKSKFLKNYVIAQVPLEKFDAFMKRFTLENRFKEVSLSEFVAECKAELGIDLTDFIEKWYVDNHSAPLAIRDVDANKILIDDYTKYQIRFKVNNPSDVDAVITVKAVDGGQGRGGRGRRGRGNVAPTTGDEMNYIIPRNSAREVKLIRDERPGRMTVNTNVSTNLPNQFEYNFSKIDNEIRDTSSGAFEISPSLFTPDINEIIVDNEDSGFRIIESNQKHKLKDLFKQEEKEKYYNFRSWRAPSKWTAIVGNNCYGTTVNSAVYKSKGKGLNQVEWEADIPKDNYYEVFVWKPTMDMVMMMNMQHGRSAKVSQQQSYTVHYGEEKETVELDFDQLETGWASLGSFFLPSGKVTVTLNDQVSGQYVIADAVKFVKLKN